MNPAVPITPPRVLSSNGGSNAIGPIATPIKKLEKPSLIFPSGFDLTRNELTIIPMIIHPIHQATISPINSSIEFFLHLTNTVALSTLQNIYSVGDDVLLSRRCC